MVVEIFVGVVGSLLAALILNELAARAPRTTDKLLERAVRTLPRRYRDRFREEWASDIAEQPTTASRMFFAAGLNYGARKILYRERKRVAVARAASRPIMVSIAGNAFTFHLTFFEVVLSNAFGEGAGVLAGILRHFAVRNASFFILGVFGSFVVGLYLYRAGY